MQRRVLLFLGLLVCVPAVAQAAVTITAGSHPLLADTPGQVIDILVSSDGEGINVVDLYMTIDGNVGPAASFEGYNPWGAPTVWDDPPGGAGNWTDNGYPAVSPGDLKFAQGVALNNVNNDVSGNGIIAQVTIDTTGFFFGDGPWVLQLTNEDWGDTSVANSDGVPETFLIDGEISIVPEPASLVMGLFAAAALGAVVIRRRRVRTAA
jgi:hypothetical protein